MKHELKPGALVQIWDHQCSQGRAPTITEHGSIGYLVKPSKLSVQKGSITSGVIWEVICFGQDPPIKHNVHEMWINPIHTSSDIKKRHRPLK